MSRATAERGGVIGDGGPRIPVGLPALSVSETPTYGLSIV
jgi:hypothetical protein